MMFFGLEMMNLSKAEKKFLKHAAIALCALIEARESAIAVNTGMILVVQKSEDYAEKPDDILINELMAYARDILPVYDVPEKIVFVNAIPMTTGGSIDRKALQVHVFDDRRSV